MKKSIVALLAAAVAVLAGCQSTGTQSSDGAAGSTSSSTSRVPTASTMPTDWPAEVPVVGGSIAVSTSSGAGAGKTWVLEYYSDDLGATWSTAQRQFADAGFVKSDEVTNADGSIEARFDGAGFTVRTKVYSEVENGEDEIRYVVVRSGS